MDLLAFVIGVAVLLGAAFVFNAWLTRRAADRRRCRDWADRTERELDHPTRD